MGLEVKTGDLFNEVMGKRVVVVHGCNAQSVMGSGFARLIRTNYPHAYLSYKQHAQRRGLRLGQVVISDPLGNTGPVIANAITQTYYGREVGKIYIDYEAIVVSMQAVAKYATEKNLPVHLPLIGGGLGGGDAKRLTAIFQAVFHANDATLWLHDE